MSEESDLEEMCLYLIAKGKYSNISAAKADALEREQYFEGLGLYDEVGSMKGASLTHKMIHALIYGHNLHGEIEAGGGQLPPIESVQVPERENASNLPTVLLILLGICALSAGIVMNHVL